MAHFKLNEGFNAEDFVVDAQLDQDAQRHSIFELNIPDKLCLFRTADDTYTTLTLNDEHIAALQEALTPTWHNEGDKIQIFAIFNDGEYYCQRLLSKFDFKTKTVTNRKYEFNELTYTEATEVFEIAKAVCWIRTEQQVESLDQDLAQVSETPLFADKQYSQRLGERNALLKNSDYRMLPDYAGSHQTEWQAYRSALRSIPKKEDQFDERADWLAYLSQMPFPIDPAAWKVNDNIKDLPYDLTNDAFWSTTHAIHSSAIDAELADQLLARKARKKQIEQYGKTAPRQVASIIEKYALDAKMMNFDFSTYTVTGE